MLKNGKAPSEIADIVINAIKKQRVLILPHPGLGRYHSRAFRRDTLQKRTTGSGVPAFLTPREDGRSTDH
ncbi:MAG: hypothetical protein CM1200mP9_09250 [Gammaproteobacteria bacterium]|nr:MAG: hypothetical protein CM1200mP9_09250 [Gammaproteobacteria bacterium]